MHGWTLIDIEQPLPASDAVRQMHSNPEIFSLREKMCIGIDICSPHSMGNYRQTCINVNMCIDPCAYLTCIPCHINVTTPRYALLTLP